VPAVTGLLSPSAQCWAPFEIQLDWSMDESDHSDSLIMKRAEGSRTPNHDQQDGDAAALGSPPTARPPRDTDPSTGLHRAYPDHDQLPVRNCELPLTIDFAQDQQEAH
jgi:hypothetical protein